jgi:hypothetical protein
MFVYVADFNHGQSKGRCFLADLATVTSILGMKLSKYQNKPSYFFSFRQKNPPEKGIFTAILRLSVTFLLAGGLLLLSLAYFVLFVCTDGRPR